MGRRNVCWSTHFSLPPLRGHEDPPEARPLPPAGPNAPPGGPPTASISCPRRRILRGFTFRGFIFFFAVLKATVTSSHFLRFFFILLGVRESHSPLKISQSKNTKLSLHPTQEFSRNFPLSSNPPNAIQNSSLTFLNPLAISLLVKLISAAICL